MLESIIRKMVVESLSKDSDELERTNPEDNGRINQEMDSDWSELEKVNKMYANSATKNPVLAPGYNHNVEDGREEAEAFTSMYESKLYNSIRRMVSESLNEIPMTR